MLDGALTGRISLERLSWILSEGTARLYGLFPRKGTIRPGADADLTMVDPEGESVVSNERLHSKHPLSPWDGAHLPGTVTVAVVRGNVVMRGGEPTGEPLGHLVRPVENREAAGSLD
jgi:dihydroorotase-like cyclic amidohydrolase